MHQINGIGNIGSALAAQAGALGDFPENIANQLGDLPATLEVLSGLSQTFLENVLTVLTGTDRGSVPSGIQEALELIQKATSPPPSPTSPFFQSPRRSQFRKS